MSIDLYAFDLFSITFPRNDDFLDEIINDFDAS